MIQSLKPIKTTRYVMITSAMVSVVRIPAYLDIGMNPYGYLISCTCRRLEITASISGSNRYLSKPPQKVSPFDSSPRSEPFRTTIISRLGITNNIWFPAPAPAKASRGTDSHTPSKFVHHPSPLPGCGAPFSLCGSGVPE